MEKNVDCKCCEWIGDEVADSSQRDEDAGGGKAWGEPEMFCVSVTLFSPLFHHKELALREDVYTKRLHPSRLLGVHSSVIDIVNQRRHTSDKPIGGINKLTITAQWGEFPSSLYVHTFHSPPPAQTLSSAPRILLLCTAKQACPTFIALFPPFTWIKMHVSDVNIRFYWAVKVTKNKKTELNWRKNTMFIFGINCVIPFIWYSFSVI